MSVRQSARSIREAVVQSLEGRRLLSAGTVDTTFGTNGVADPGIASGYGRNQLVQPDGKVILLQSSRATRVNADGTRDWTFGTNGTIEFPAGQNFSAVTPDGKLVTVSTTGINGRNVVVHRYTSSGTPDPTFQGNGSTTVTFPPGPAARAGAYDQTGIGKAMVDGAGRVLFVVAGWTGDNAGYLSTTDSTLVRLTSSGVLDTSFSGDGFATVGRDAGGNSYLINDLVQTPDGNYEVGGYTPTGQRAFYVRQLDVERVKEDGSSSRFASVPTPSPLYYVGEMKLAAQPDGKLLFGVPQPSGGPSYVIRLTSALEVDTTFGDHGAYTVVGYTDGVATRLYGVEAQPDGKPLLGTLALDPAAADGTPQRFRFQVQRLTLAGQLDASYGNGGIAATPLTISAPSSGGVYSAFGFADIGLLPNGQVMGSTIDDGAAGPAANLKLTRLTTDLVPPAKPAGAKLGGNAIGTPGSYKNNGKTFAKAVDGDIATYFDGANADGDWAGLDLGAAYNLTGVAYASRSGWDFRMRGGVFQASNSPNFDYGVVNLYTIGSTESPPAASLTTRLVSPAGTYRYVRYLSPNGSYGNVSEVQVFGTLATTGSKLNGTTIGTAGSYNNAGNTIAKATDGNLSTYFDGPGSNGNWVGLDLGGACDITSVSYAARSGLESRMNGGVFQASNSANFSTGVVTLYTVGSTENPPSGRLTSRQVTASGFRYVRYFSPYGSFGNVAEVQFFGKPSATFARLNGTTIGTRGSYLQNGFNTIANATDGNVGSYFDGPTSNGNWVGYDLGSTKTIRQIAYAPRPQWADRMLGGQVQISTTADFSSGVSTLLTITSAPPEYTLTTYTLAKSANARYIRYLSPNGSYGNIAELEVFA